MVNVRVIFAVLVLMIMSGCAALQQQMGAVSLDSYIQGCIYRGQEQGISSDKASELCHCHVNAAIEKSSRQEFLDAASRLANATKEEKLSGALKHEMVLVKHTFKQCKTSLGL
ncbi:hypothetical protein A9Q99_11650 [Gammaproteobacteria bacterium 45_16_T64]|nr:hypothetical protein A9Q99_11650 [Gammaproteobacteria bacterium 45_16_T64]